MVNARGMQSRIRKVQASLNRPFGYVHVDVTPQGRIVFRAGRLVSVILWIVFAAFAPLCLWVAGEAAPGAGEYALLAVAGAIALLALVSIHRAIFPAPYFEVDPESELIIIYRHFPNRRPQDHVSLSEIRVFVAHAYRWKVYPEATCDAVTESGTAYRLISSLGSASPDPPMKALGYLCRKRAVRVNEAEPAEPFGRTGGAIDVESLLSSADALYDPAAEGADRAG